MRKTLFKSLAILGLSSFVFSLHAQSGQYLTVRDMETWSSLNLDFKASKKLKFGLGEQLRLKDNSSSVQQYFTNLYGEYKINKSFEVGVEGRFIRNNDDVGKIQGYENHLRLAAYTSFQHEIKRVGLKYRLQYQNKNELGISEAEGDDPIQKIRLKIGATYNFPKWKFDPKISGELFRNIGSVNQFSKIRGTIGTKYSFKNAGAIGAFFRIEKELNETYPQTSHIIGLNYTYTIKRNKK